MGDRGRTSSKALEALTPSPIEVVDRLRPPHNLTDEECEVWVAVVASEPADWFRPSHVPALKQYCRHSVGSDRVAELIERALSDKDLDPNNYDRLLRMQQRETLAILQAATKLRITPQSITNHRGNKTKRGTAGKPWDFS